MKKWNFVATLLFACLLVFGLSAFYSPAHRPLEMLPLSKGDPYSDLWKRADSLQSKGLSKSALEQINVIYDKAKSEQNNGQIVKSLMYMGKYTQFVEEDAFYKNITRLQDEEKYAIYPLKPILQSMLAEIYAQYTLQNYWRMQSRTETAGVEEEDFRTWDLKTLTHKSLELYVASLSSKDSLMRTPVEIYDDVITPGYNGRVFRPTLYDFLAHRAVDYLMNEQSYLPQPAYRFQMEGKEPFSSAGFFSQYEFTTRDTTSYKFQTILIFQDLLGLHVRDKDPTARVMADLKRLQFVYQNSIHPEKDRLYEEALENLESTARKYPVSAWATYYRAQFWFEQGAQYQPLEETESHRYDYAKAYEIAQKGIDRFMDSDGGLNCRYVQRQIETKDLGLAIEKVNVPDQAFRCRVGYRNLDQIHIRIVKIPEEDEFHQMYEDDRYTFLTTLEPVKSWTQKLPATKDYQKHSTEIEMPDLPVGQYVVLAATSPEFTKQKEAVAYATTHISNLSFVHRRDARERQTVFVFDRTTGEPLANVVAQVWEEYYDYNEYKYVFKKGEKLLTDKNGSFVIKAPKDEYRQVTFEFSTETDHLHTLDVIGLSPHYDRTANYSHTTFFTDRAMYRPGQTIYFKGIMLQYKGETPFIQANTRTTVELVDVNYQVVDRLELRTNDYGTVEGAFTAPQGVLTGQMHIRNGSGTTFFSVEEYKRPKFEVNFDPVAGSFKLGEKVKVSGRAKAYAGSNIDGAEVRYRVTRQASFPWWWGGWGWGWNPYSGSDPMEIINGTTTTDETGAYEIEFTAQADPSIDPSRLPQFQYMVYADVTDISGETRSSSTRVNVGYVALNIDLAIPGKLDQDQVQKFKIAATNLNGEPEIAKGRVEVYQLEQPEALYRERFWERADQFTMDEEEYHDLFPHDVHEKEDDYSTWEKVDKVFNSSFFTKTSDSLDLENISVWEEGKYLLELQTEDKFGKEVTLKKYFTVYSSESKEMPIPELMMYHPVKKVVEPGDKAVFMIGSSAKNAKVLFEVEFKGQLVFSEWLTLNNEKRRIEIPVKEKHRGNLSYSLIMVNQGRYRMITENVIVPWSNKQLKMEFETFRDKLQPGQEEEWRLKISGPKGDAVAAEMVATMYDASLDAFDPHSWGFFPWRSRSNTHYWSGNETFTYVTQQMFQENWNQVFGYRTISYDQLNWHGWNSWYNYANRMYYGYSYSGVEEREISMNANQVVFDSFDMDAETEKLVLNAPVATGTISETKVPSKDGKSKLDYVPGVQAGFGDETVANGRTGKDKDYRKGLSEVKVRTNLNETAFFFPKLRTNDKGEVILAFTIPEALTRWKMMGVAHTTELESGFITQNTVTQKELMVMPNTPRFFRENDKMTFTAKVSNLSDKDLSGAAQLELLDAFTGKPVDAQFKNFTPLVDFSVKKEQSTRLAWTLKVPEDVQAVTVRVKAAAGNFTDGEENVLPVLTNRMLVTETMPLPVREKQTKTFTFDKLKNNQSETLKHHRLTLEFTSNPAWYAIQALPYLMEYPYECNEQVFSRFYANSIASHVANSSPKIKMVFDSWKNESPEALLSNLEKNQELKALLLEETPWVLHAQNESARKRRVGLLFDLNRMGNELDAAVAKLAKNQVSNGGWPWFKGGPDSRYITQHIVCGMGHLDHLGVKSIREDNRVWNMTRKAVLYCDNQMRKDYDGLLKHASNMEDDHLGGTNIHYLYARTYFPDIPMSARDREAFDYYLGQADTYWLEKMRYYQGMISLALQREDNQSTAMDIIKSLKENSIYNEELGRYWKSNTGGYYWYQAPIETQAMLIEAFDEVANDQQAVGEMQVWLLKQKQTQDWRTTKATVEACYALLLRGTDFLSESKMADISVGGKPLDLSGNGDIKVEAGTGYFKTAWSGDEVTPEMGEVTVKNNNNVVAWGGMYWQYFEQLDKISAAETPLKLEKKLFLEKPGDTGPVLTEINEKTRLRPGDKVKVRIILRVDRRMEYIHMKDMRAAGFEPINVISRYKFQDGLGYYEATRDAATNFFISAINQGTYVFEYPLRVTHAGNFSNGITTIQCMYAPEFASHSEGIRVQVK